MNFPPRVRNIILFGFLLFVCAVVIGNLYSGYRTLQRAQQARAASALEQVIPINAPAFTLTDQTGAPFESASLKGKVWLAGFVFTTCPGPCGLITRRMAEIRDATADLPGLHIVSFTVDPEMDTPERLAAYGELFDADPTRWTFLTGPPDEVYKTIRAGFLQYAEIAPEEEQPTYGRVIHSTRLALMDRNGRIREFIDGVDDDAVARTIAALRALHAED